MESSQWATVSALTKARREMSDGPERVDIQHCRIVPDGVADGALLGMLQRETLHRANLQNLFLNSSASGAPCRS